MDEDNAQASWNLSHKKVSQFWLESICSTDGRKKIARIRFRLLSQVCNSLSLIPAFFFTRLLEDNPAPPNISVIEHLSRVVTQVESVNNIMNTTSLLTGMGQEAQSLLATVPTTSAPATTDAMSQLRHSLEANAGLLLSTAPAGTNQPSCQRTWSLDDLAATARKMTADNVPPTAQPPPSTTTPEPPPSASSQGVSPAPSEYND